MKPRESIPESAIPGLITALGSPWGPETDLEVKLWEGAGDSCRPDFKVIVRWSDRAFEFAAEAKSRSTPRALQQAANRAREYADATGQLAMVIVPYLNERSLDWLEDRGVSGIDFSGNGLAIVPSVLYLRRSGQPNRYRESQPMRYAYRGATSIVPRVFLCRREFESVKAIKSEIESRGGKVALSTVSKALARMVEDVLIRRTESNITLLQPDALLDKLRESFEKPSGARTVTLKVGDLDQFFQRIDEGERRSQLVLSGASSQSRYAAGLRSDQPETYCENLDVVRRRAGDLWAESDRFADLTIVETRDRTPFFDTRQDEFEIVYASPVQTYLELAVGDKRDREMAEDIRQSILSDIA